MQNINNFGFMLNHMDVVQRSIPNNIWYNVRNPNSIFKILIG